MIVLALCLSALASSDLEVVADHGFQVEVPSDWTTFDRTAGGTFEFWLLPPGSSGTHGAVVRVSSIAPGRDLVDVAAERSVALRAAGAELEPWEGTVAGAESHGFQFEYTEGEQRFRVQQRYAIRAARFYSIQFHAPQDEWDDVAEAYSAAVETFAYAELDEEAVAEERRLELVHRCGSEVDWADSFDAAAERARRDDRLVLGVAFLYSGFDITTSPRTTTFMDEDVIALVQEHYVPFEVTRSDESAFAESYGLSPYAFGQGLIVATPEGEILRETEHASQPLIAYEFLRRVALEFTADASSDRGVEGAREALRCGRLEAALLALEGDDSPTADLVRADVYRLQFRPEEALQTVRRANEGGAVGAAGWLLEAQLALRSGEPASARRAYEQVLELGTGTEASAEATLGLGMVDFVDRRTESTRERWNELVETAPESRWAWQAAASLASPILDLDIVPKMGWPSRAIVDELLYVRPTVDAEPDADDLARGARDWLRATQRADGSWFSPTSLDGIEGGGADPFVDAITSLAVRGLLPQKADRQVAEHALDFLVTSIDSRALEPPQVHYMDYMTWSDGLMLHAIADALDANVGDGAELQRSAAILTADLVRRQQPNGGWSYYVTGKLGEQAAAQSISFTTAAVVSGLARAREVGLEVPDELLDGGHRALRAMRGDDGLFSYFLHEGDVRSTVRPLGAVGRGPGCELALWACGSGSEERVLEAVERYVDAIELYEAERGKVIMHAGPGSQGCHYLLFDHGHAALGSAVAKADRKTRVRLLEAVRDCAAGEGSFLDTPMLGRAYGTAMALLALNALDH